MKIFISQDVQGSWQPVTIFTMFFNINMLSWNFCDNWIVYTGTGTGWLWSKLDPLNLLAKLIKDMEATIRWNSEAQARPQERLGAKEKKARQALAKQEAAERWVALDSLVAKAQRQRKATEEIILWGARSIPMPRSWIKTKQIDNNQSKDIYFCCQHKCSARTRTE